MTTIKIRRKISSQQIRISELKDFIGKYVEITVTEKPQVKKSFKKAAGILSVFGNKEKNSLEKQAWKKNVQEKHGNL